MMTGHASDAGGDINARGVARVGSQSNLYSPRHPEMADDLSAHKRHTITGAGPVHTQSKATANKRPLMSELVSQSKYQSHETT